MSTSVLTTPSTPTTHVSVPSASDRRGRSVHDRRWVILAVLCLSLFISVLDDTIMNVTLPSLVRQLGATTSQLQWIVDAFALVFAGLLLAAGSLGDRFGRKRALLIGLGVFATFSAAGSAASSSGQLIAARAAMGIGAALIFPTTLAILSNVFTDAKERAKAIGIWAAITGAAVALGPIAGGFLLEHFWWGSVLLINVPICAIAIALGWRILPESKDEHAPRLDLGGLALSIIAVGTLVYSVIEAPQVGWASVRTMTGFAIAALAALVFLAWERSVEHPMLDIAVFSNARFSAASVSITTAFFALFGFIFTVTQYLQFVKGYDTLATGVRTLPFAVATGFAAPVAVKLTARIGTKYVVASGLAIMAAGFCLTATFGASTSYSVIAFSMILLGGGLGLIMAPATESIMGSLPAEKAGVGSAVNDTTRQLGGTLGVAVVGSLFASAYGEKVTSALRGILPSPAVRAARSSIGAAYAVADAAPAGARPLIRSAASDAFLAGFARGAIVTGAVAALGSVIALAFLPARSPQVTAADGTPRPY
ncbi:MAG: DHA2 family efflux MFS transporter permease subunit [Ilumatobacteraceae bacterium]